MIDPALQEQLASSGPDDEAEAVMLLQPGHAPPLPARPVARFGDVVTCRLDVNAVVEVRSHPSVLALKASRVYGGTAAVAGEPVVEPVPGATLRRGAWDATGRGVVLAVLDWGCDFAHPNFLRDDGGTRLLALWDQRRPARHAGHRYGYGTIHHSHDIDRALASPDPYAALGYHPAEADPSGRGTHGTHVMDIAAGNGRRDGSLVGVAPETDLIFVHLAARSTPLLGDLGDSVRVLEAVDLVRQTAGDRPWVVNMSLGRTGGDHTGRSLVERALDHVLEERPGRACVLSAGNYFAKSLHAEGLLRPGGRAVLDWLVAPDDRTANELEVWYSGRDRYVVRLVTPEGGVVAAGLDERRSVLVDGREVGRLYHRAEDSASGDHHIDLFLDARAPSGRWQVVLEGLDVVDGRYHAWVERDVSRAMQSSFAPGQASPRSTIGTIANGYRTLVVGAYEPESGELGTFSSSGPTRDGRSKPDLIAPGVEVLAARSTPRGLAPGQGGLVHMSGTSMATPHVAGATALIFQASGRPLRIEETRALLLGNASGQEGYDLPRAGAGRLDVEKALAAAGEMTAASEAQVQAEAVDVPQEGAPTAMAAGDLAIQALGDTPDSLYHQVIAGSTAPLPGGAQVVALPGQRLPAPSPEDGDDVLVLVRVALGEPGLGCVATLAGGELALPGHLAAQGVVVEDGPPGGYAIVREAAPHLPPRARRITDGEGVVPPGQMLLRLRSRAARLDAADQADEPRAGGPPPVAAFPSAYAAPFTDDAALTAKLAAAVAAASRPGLSSDIPISIVVLKDDGTRLHAGNRHEEMHYSGSLIKIAAMYAAFELRAAVDRVLAAKPATTPKAALDELVKVLNPQIAAAAAKEITGLPAASLAKVLQPDYPTVFKLPPAAGRTTAFTGLMEGFLTSMIAVGTNTHASKTIHALGYGYLSAALIKGGFFQPDPDPPKNKGLWLASDYLQPGDPGNWDEDGRVASVNDTDAASGTTTVQLAKLLTLMWDKKLVDGASSDAMLKLLKGARDSGFKPWILRSIAGPASFKVTHNKLGEGWLKPANGNKLVMSEASIITDVKAGVTRRFVVVWQNLSKTGPDSDPFGPVARLVKEFLARA
jgi:subtilisin family serine protease